MSALPHQTPPPQSQHLQYNTGLHAPHHPKCRLSARKLHIMATTSTKNLGTLVGYSSIPIIAWLLVGAVAHSPWAHEVLQYLVVIFSFYLQACVIGVAVDEDILSHAYLMAGLAGVVFTTLTVILLPAWTTVARGAFWCNSSFYLGIVGEGMTGYIAALSESLSKYEFSQASGIRRRATSSDEASQQGRDKATE